MPRASSPATPAIDVNVQKDCREGVRGVDVHNNIGRFLQLDRVLVLVGGGVLDLQRKDVTVVLDLEQIEI